LEKKGRKNFTIASINESVIISLGLFKVLRQKF